MKIKDYQCKCGHYDFFFADKGSQKGIYCSYCGKWFKWADKDEQNLLMKEESIIDNIRAEINSPNRGICDYFIVDRIEEIINKHRKGESE